MCAESKVHNYFASRLSGCFSLSNEEQERLQHTIGLCAMWKFMAFIVFSAGSITEKSVSVLDYM